MKTKPSGNGYKICRNCGTLNVVRKKKCAASYCRGNRFDPAPDALVEARKESINRAIAYLETLSERGTENS